MVLLFRDDVKVILFGSRARGNELKNSDIDLIVISEDFREMNFFERLELLELKWEYAIPIEALGYTPQEYDEMSRYIGIVAEAGKYGKVIYG